MGAEGSSKTVTLIETTRRHIPQNRALRANRRENRQISQCKGY